MCFSCSFLGLSLVHNVLIFLINFYLEKVIETYRDKLYVSIETNQRPENLATDTVTTFIREESCYETYTGNFCVNYMII